MLYSLGGFFLPKFFILLIIKKIKVMENTSKILEKLSKLKALYESAKMDNEGEANAAAAAIQRLLLKYNLSMEDIDANLNSNSDVWVHEYISGYTQKSIGGQWELELWSALCEFNFCKVFMCGGSYKNLMLVGKKENLDNIKWLNNFLQTVFVKLSKVRYKEYCRSLLTKPIACDTFQRNYLYGCAIGLRKKLKDETATIAAEKITALAVRSNDAIMSYVTDMFGRVATKRHSAIPKNYSAQKMGYEDGRKIKIGKPIEKKESQVLLR